MAAALLVPVKDFSRAKLRLAPGLDDQVRRELSRDLATHVLGAAGDLDVYVVCDDPAVRTWAESCGAQVIWTPGLGLIGAVQLGVDELRRRGVAKAVVSHSDLPLARNLDAVADFDGITLVPDRFGDGTNIACVPTDAGFTFAYGPGSFRRHVAETLRLGLGLRVVRDRRLSWDVDRLQDLALPPDLRNVFPLPPAVAASGNR